MEAAAEEPVAANASMSLGSLMKLPSLFMTSLRKLDEILTHDFEAMDGASDDYVETGMHNVQQFRTTPPPHFAPLPGPWGFMTSGYILGLIAMAILLNRIQNIVVPSRHPFSARVSRHNRNGVPLYRAVFRAMFPLDLSSTICRLTLRMPSLYFVIKALLVWVVVLLQTSGNFPPWNLYWLRRVGESVANQEMEDICWRTFCAVCGALAVESLTRGLEGASLSGNPAPFNLFGYAFLLHIYSSSMTHTVQTPDMKSRPDKHVVVTIIMPLFQLAMIHALGVKQTWSRQRLIPSSLAAGLSLLHFHCVLWLSPSSYPLLNYMPCLFETGLILVTLLAIFLNGLTQLLLEGAISRPLFGHQATLLPKMDEDFSIVLLRLGTASLEATSVAGLGNEVGSATVSTSLSPSRPTFEYGRIEMNRGGVSSMSPTVEGRGRRKRVKQGFLNEIKTISTSPAESNPGELWIDANWFRELLRFGTGVARVGKGFWRLFLAMIGQRALPHRRARTSSDASGSSAERRRRRSAPSRMDSRDPSDLYQRFLRGENVSDDEDEFDPAGFSPSHSREGSETPTTASASDDEGDEDRYADETVDLFTDLSEAASTSASAPLLLAHMTDATSSPLTRRRYSTLVSSPASLADPAMDEWSDVSSVRRPEAGAGQNAAQDFSLSEAQRNCVICTVEPRQVICWPCRCLALCDDCRENLASRSSAAKHSCPCCRRSVEGYSKIFIP